MPNTREKLIELVREVQYQGNAVHGFHDKYIQNSELADHLIANGVTLPVRCKDCKHYKPQTKSVHRESKALYCCRCASTKTGPDDFCSYGERKEA